MNRRVISRTISSTSRAARLRPSAGRRGVRRRRTRRSRPSVHHPHRGVAAAWSGCGGRTAPGPPGSPLVAVRAFRNLSQDPSQSYFTEGMTDEIRGQLSKIAAFRVLSRSAAERFRQRGWPDDRPRFRRPDPGRRQCAGGAQPGARRRGAGRCRDTTDAMVGTVRRELAESHTCSARSRWESRSASPPRCRRPSGRASKGCRPQNTERTRCICARRRSVDARRRERNLRGSRCCSRRSRSIRNLRSPRRRMSYRVFFRAYTRTEVRERCDRAGARGRRDRSDARGSSL